MHLKQILKEKNMKDHELAGKAGVPTSRIAKCLSGMIELLTPERERVEAVLGKVDWQETSMWKDFPFFGLNGAMKKHGVIQSELCNASHVSQSRVSMILNGLTAANKHERERIELCLGKIDWEDKDMKSNTGEEPLEQPSMFPDIKGAGQTSDESPDNNTMPTMKFKPKTKE